MHFIRLVQDHPGMVATNNAWILSFSVCLFNESQLAVLSQRQSKYTFDPKASLTSINNFWASKPKK